MNAINELLQAAQMMAQAAGAQSKTQSSEHTAPDGEFQKLLHEKGETGTSHDGAAQKGEKDDAKPTDEVLAQAVEAAPAEVADEIAAALLVSPVTLVGQVEQSYTAAEPQPIVQPVAGAIPEGQAVQEVAAAAEPVGEAAVAVQTVQQPAVQTQQAEQPVVAAPVSEQTVVAQGQSEGAVRTDAAAQTAPEGEVQQTAQPDVAVKDVRQQPTGDNQQQDTGKGAETLNQKSFETLDVQSGEQVETPLFRELQGTPVKVGDGQQVDTQAPDVEGQLGKQIGTALEKGAQRIEIQLTPENLGTVTIQLTQNADGTLQVLMSAATDKGAALLNEHAAGLSDLLRANQQAPVQIEVQQQENQQQQQRSMEDGHQQRQSQQQREQAPQDDGENFLQQLRLGLVSWDGQAG